ncbi:hypothetical protein CEXT_564441 [Caerostris extrusa]|uniref:DUF2829 domain-containing protein n=1 Tax=Caerostris extrusa TaxID=172846 RepID=A0AAV4WE40_CAEEX|nr:hypothetical protein CEXT_564441 [Caerostris extrusa]
MGRIWIFSATDDLAGDDWELSRRLLPVSSSGRMRLSWEQGESFGDFCFYSVKMVPSELVWASTLITTILCWEFADGEIWIFSAKDDLVGDDWEFLAGFFPFSSSGRMVN